MHHVILGAGPAGVTAAESLRKHASDARITLIGGEPEPPYSRMAIPYLLTGAIGEDGTHLRQSPGHYDTLDIAYRHGRAAAVDAQAKQVRFDNGSEIAYDRLLIATGASPIRPPIDGLDLAGVHTCWTLADARAIMEETSQGDPVVLVGAGFIGSIILEALVARGVRLSVVEQGDRMVPRMLDETAGTMLKRWCEEKGVRVLTGCTVARITRANGAQAAGSEKQPGGFFGRLFSGGESHVKSTEQAGAGAGSGAASAPLQVELSDGERLPARLVVIAAGVRSNIDFVAGSGIATDRGVQVDDHLCASLPDIYAAGDCAQAKNFSSAQFDVLAIQPTAVEHGALAALNMAGLSTPYRGGLNMNVLDTMGLISSSFGLWYGVPGGEGAQTVSETDWRYLRLEFDGDRLVGGQAVGWTEGIGMMRGLIHTGLRLGRWKDKLMREPERLAEAYVATAQGLLPR